MRFFIILALLIISGCANSAPKTDYLSNSSDPIQQKYSKAVLGYALNTKCAILPKSMKKSYNDDLDLSSKIFLRHLQDTNVIKSQRQADTYLEDIWYGAAKFIGHSEQKCDASAKKIVENGRVATFEILEFAAKKHGL